MVSKKAILFGLSLLFVVAVFANSADQKWSWNRPNALVRKTGDLEWQPKPFVFKKGRSIRYIDYKNGNDNNPGTKAKPWKHHPWDAKAKGNATRCNGIHTYVFKKGVVYRGSLKVKESGSRQEPIRLTCDPTWGNGEAIIAGSEVVRSWEQGADHKDILNKEKVWYADLSFNPRNVWMVENNNISRIPLARTPNWKVSDPDDVKSEWFHWNNPGKHFGHRDGKWHKAFDTKNINKPTDYYKNAVLWTEWGWVMGTPFPTLVRKVDTKAKSLSFRGQWGGPTGQIIRYNRYYLEDKPHYLDDPNGEFWFQKKGKNGGRLFLRVPDGKNPNNLQIEAAKHFNLIDSKKMDHIEISGLSFRFTNTFWNLTAGPWVNPNVDPACIRLLGSGRDIIVKNCKFDNTTLAIRVKSLAVNDEINDLVITDNIIQKTDHGGILLEDGGGWGKKDEKIGRLLEVKLLRNKLTLIGMRPNRFVQGHAMVVDTAETLEIAGNILDRCYGSGIHIFGAKRSMLAADRPLSRVLIHHNKVTNPMLNTNDWGGIETWQGGPMYVYNNISGNPGGYWHWKFKNHPDQPACGRFGHAYYLDGAFKNYLFNNIAWGKSKDPYSRLGNTSAFQEIHSYQNTFFNNTAYNFVIGSRRQAPHAGRDKFLSNIWDAIGYRVFRHSDPAKSMAEANAKDAGKQKDHFAYETNAYSNNIFHDVAKYGVYEASGRWLDSYDEFKSTLKKHKSITYDLGTESIETPLRNPAKHDFRLKANSPAINQGSKVFVPWSLYAMVGEWNFYPAGNDPSRILDEHWYMAPYYTDRGEYHDKPMFPLKAVNVSSKDYVKGPLEDWIKGALKLNGKNQYAVLDNTKLESKKSESKEKKSFKKQTYNWVKIAPLDSLKPKKKAQIKVELTGIPKGHYVHADLHWHRKNNTWGGFNTSGGKKKVTGSGPYTFTVTPKDKPSIGAYEILVFVSKDGTWKGQTHLARQKVSAKSGLNSEAIKLRSPQIEDSNFAIEVYFKTEKGQINGVVAEKMTTSGYSLTINADGKMTIKLQSKNDAAKLVSKRKVNDGSWHHVIVECDRKTKTLTFYIDGKKDASGQGIGSNVNLKNDGNLYVGGTPNGRCLAATFDFLRISQGTLADAKTTIDELYAWQFNGPFLRDFTSHPPVGPRRDAGALEYLK